MHLLCEELKKPYFKINRCEALRVIYIKRDRERTPRELKGMRKSKKLRRSLGVFIGEENLNVGFKFSMISWRVYTGVGEKFGETSDNAKRDEEKI